MKRATAIFLTMMGLALSAPIGLLAADATVGDKQVDVNAIIDAFVHKETEFTRAREAYTYVQKVKLTEYEGTRPSGTWELEQHVIFGPNRERIEKVVYAPVATLQRISLSPQDMQDLRDVQPFIMTEENRHEYQIDYLGMQKVDEIDTYVFSVKPKEIVRGKRYFQGQIWVDQRDLQVVKSYGKGVGFQKKNDDQAFPAFETYRDQIDGKYWFPVFTIAEDTLQFKSGQQVPIKLIIKYEDYKRFGAESGITFGDIIDDTGAQEQTPQQPQ